MYRNARRRCLDDYARNLLGSANLGINQPQHELMIFLQQPGRIDEVRASHRLEDVGNRNPGHQQLGRIGDDMKFRLLAALHEDCRDAVQPIQARLDFIGRHFPQPGLLNGVGAQAVAYDGETGERQAMGFDFRARWKFGLRAR